MEPNGEPPDRTDRVEPGAAETARTDGGTVRTDGGTTRTEGGTARIEGETARTEGGTIRTDSETAQTEGGTAAVHGATSSGGGETEASQPDEPEDPSAVWGVSTRTAGRASGPARYTATGPAGDPASGLTGSLGAGLVSVPPVPAVDPKAQLMVDPATPEHKRRCERCGRDVGRGREGRPGRPTGHCTFDRTPFDFTPTLKPGTLVARQYEVAGCIAHGGQGWIYLAVDRNVEDQWVVLKGVLAGGDDEARRAFTDERRYLAQVNHANVVTLHNFVRHPEDDEEGDGYLVLEYVGGSSLRQLLEAQRREDAGYDPLPAGQVMAYGLEILKALDDLHASGLVYCDLKPDNVIQHGQRLTLVDLGAVTHVGNRNGPWYGTYGYQAPEIGERWPSPCSDLYTLGRTLMVLALATPPLTGNRPTELPTPDQDPVLRRHPSLYRLLRRATAEDPARRFGTAGEMAVQLEAVLREVLAQDGGDVHAAPSTVFSSPSRLASFAPSLLPGQAGPGRPDPARVAELLPPPLPDPADPATGLLSSTEQAERDDVVGIVRSVRDPSPELQLRLVRAHLAAGDTAAATAVLDDLAAAAPDAWRPTWFRGLVALATAAAGDAHDAFDAVYSRFPGELAPKLALAAAAECRGDDGLADAYYTLAGLADPALTDAAFGLARVRLRAGDRTGAVRALDRFPAGTSDYPTAQLAATAATLLGRQGGEVGVDELHGEAARVERLDPGERAVQQARADLLRAAIERVTGESLPPDEDPLFGVPWREDDLRLALERCLRRLAGLSPDPWERVHLVDLANEVHPLTWT